MKTTKLFTVAGCLAAGYLAGWTSCNDVYATSKTEKSAAENKPGYTIDGCLNVFDRAKAETAQSGWFYWFMREPATETGMNLKMSYVDRQTETHPPHQHPEKEIYYILEGQAEVFLAGNTRVIGPNTSMYCPPGMMHGIKRADGKPLKYFVIREGSKSVSSSKADIDLSTYTLDKCITMFSEAKADIAKTGWYFWFEPKSLTGGINLKMTYVDKLTGTHEPHQHPGEEILYLLEGQAEVHLNGEIRVIGPNTSIYYPGNSLHCIKRVNDKPVKYLVINP